jgi:uncharacterized membrane protein YphA (DoxX/SURF4 family)
MPGLTSFDKPVRVSSGPVVGTIPLRIGAGLVLLYLHVWTQTKLAYDALWNGKPWDVIDLVKNAGLPLPKILAIAAAIVATIVTASWLLGFLTRLFSFLFMPVTLGALMVCNRNSLVGGAEIALLYFFVALTLFASGAGWLSVDVLFRRKREPKKSSLYI